MTEPVPLTHLERRVLGNLSQPINVAAMEHTLRSWDFHAGTPNAEKVEAILGDLESRGLAVNLGAHKGPHAIADATVKSKQAIDLHPEKDANYREFYSGHPGIEWTLAGNQWVMSKKGLDALTGPIPEETSPSSPQTIANRIAAEEIDKRGVQAWIDAHGKDLYGDTHDLDALLASAPEPAPDPEPDGPAPDPDAT